ncbi:glycosyltransferase [Chloroflexota bacterium]
MSANFLAHIILWLLGFVSLFHLPVCKNGKVKHATRLPVSIIVPARNEETNIPNLLRSLKGQMKADDEIIVVDDHSEDNTAAVAEQGGAKAIKSKEMPPGWTGKTWACYQGAQVANGELIIFLDADTVLEDGGLDRITSSYNKTDGVLSIQPYHKMLKLYEQLSAFFNIVLMAGMGSFTILGKIIEPIGLFGPVIVLDKKRYSESSGFERVKGEILEDLAFGSEFKKRGVKLHCFGGRHTVSFRMYPEGISQLINGWSKGFAMGAVKTSIPVLIMIIAWITGSLGTTRHLIQASVITDMSLITLWGLLYIAFASQIYWMLYRIGNFKPYTALLFPIPLIFFVIVFAYSFLIIFIRRNVRWKGRTVEVKSRGTDAIPSSDNRNDRD